MLRDNIADFWKKNTAILPIENANPEILYQT